MFEWKDKKKLADEKIVINAVNEFESRFVKFYRFVLTKNSEKTIIQKPKEYLSIIFQKNEKNFERDVYYFHCESEKAEFNFNMLAESTMLKKFLNLTLPTVKNYLLFKIALKEDYLSHDRFILMQKNNFKISDEYFPTKIKAHGLIFSDNLKNHEKKELLKIKLINNQKIDIVDFMTVKHLISDPTDIVIFITGGGFVSDMEKVAQYWLRKLVEKNFSEDELSVIYH